MTAIARETMHRAETVESEEDESVLRWGGLAGFLGGLLFILVFAIVGVFVGAEPVEPAGAVMRFPDIRAARTVENGLYLFVLALWAVHSVVLFRALQRTSPASALFGGVLSILGLAVMAVGALPHAASVPISDMYHASGATSEDRASLVLIWQAIQGVLDAQLVTGLVIVPMGLVAFGLAMLGTPAFGTRYGRVSIALGIAGLGTAIALLADPLSFIAVVGVFALIAFHLVLGWKVYRLSR